MRTGIRNGLLLLACGLSLDAQVAKQANERYQTPEQRQAVAAGLGRAGRDAQQKPEELVGAMDIKPGMTVADIGTGVGYMLPFLSKAVGPSGRVIAEDIFDDFLARARQRAAGLGNVSFVKGSERDPSLPAGAVDVALALDSYHHYDFPEQMLAGLHKGLREGGRMVVVEYYKENPSTPDGHIRLNEPGVIKEIETNHFKLLSRRVQIPGSQYMLVFQKN